MNQADIINETILREFMKSIAHFYITAGTKNDMNAIHERHKAGGFTIASELRHTEDG